MTPKNLDHLVIEVSDMNRSVTFYQDLLGLTPERLDLFRQGRAPFVSMRAGDTLIDLFPAKSDPPMGPPHFCLEFTDPMDDIVQTLAAAGVATEPPEFRFGARGMGESLYVRDPDGHQVELRSYAH